MKEAAASKSLAFHISDRIREAGNKAIDPTIFINKQFDQQRHLFLIIQRREGRRNLLLIDHHRVIPFLEPRVRSGYGSRKWATSLTSPSRRRCCVQTCEAG